MGVTTRAESSAKKRAERKRRDEKKKKKTFLIRPKASRRDHSTHFSQSLPLWRLLIQ